MRIIILHMTLLPILNSTTMSGSDLVTEVMVCFLEEERLA